MVEGSIEISESYRQTQLELLKAAKKQLQEGFHDGGDDIDYMGAASDLIYIATQLVSNPWEVDLEQMYKGAGCNEDWSVEDFLGIAAEGLGEEGVNIFRDIIKIHKKEY